VNAPLRPLYATLAVTLLVTVAAAILLARPGTEIRPVRTSAIELDEPPPGAAPR
jgi:hypothetical protein